MKKKIEIFKYRIKCFITSKYTKYENKMLNKIWEFCEPDFVNNDGVWCFVDSSGQMDIVKYTDCMIKRRRIIKRLSLNLCEPTIDKYPTKYSYNAVQNRMKLNANATYGAALTAFNTVHLTKEQRAKLNEQLERGRIGVCNDI